QTVTNNDSGLPTPGGNDTTLAHEVITFTCFKGDRTYYTDVIQLQNTTATEDWDVTLTVEADIEGSPAVEDTFTAGTADVWLFTSQVNTAVTPVSSLPNPANYGHATTPLTDWYDNDPNDATDTLDAIQLEVVGGTMSVANATTGVFEIPAGEQRQMALVVDCGRNMAPMTTGSGTFRVTLSTTPQ
ncbi:MAG: hypothetical protein U9Q12_04570, partial [Patescibacteria group bacterium]|nr:hypothetical protein [Patescibacteria group bacterium]